MRRTFVRGGGEGGWGEGRQLQDSGLERLIFECWITVKAKIGIFWRASLMKITIILHAFRHFLSSHCGSNHPFSVAVVHSGVMGVTGAHLSCLQDKSGSRRGKPSTPSHQLQMTWLTHRNRQPFTPIWSPLLTNTSLIKAKSLRKLKCA